MFNQVLVDNYALAALQFRREPASFLYLQLRETFIWAAVTDNNRFLFKSSIGIATTIGLDTGFSGIRNCISGTPGIPVIRNDKPGSGLIPIWDKSF